MRHKSTERKQRAISYSASVDPEDTRGVDVEIRRFPMSPDMPAAYGITAWAIDSNGARIPNPHQDAVTWIVAGAEPTEAPEVHDVLAAVDRNTTTDIGALAYMGFPPESRWNAFRRMPRRVVRKLRRSKH